MRHLITAVFGTVHKRRYLRESDTLIATIECELLSSEQQPRKGVVEISHRPGESEPEVVPKDSWRPFITFVDVSHAAITHYYQALRVAQENVDLPSVRVTMSVDAPVECAGSALDS